MTMGFSEAEVKMARAESRRLWAQRVRRQGFVVDAKPAARMRVSALPPELQRAKEEIQRKYRNDPQGGYAASLEAVGRYNRRRALLALLGQ